MNASPFPFADLPAEDIDRIRRLESRLSETNGHAVTLIAYENPEPDSSEPRSR